MLATGNKYLGEWGAWWRRRACRWVKDLFTRLATTFVALHKDKQSAPCALYFIMLSPSSLIICKSASQSFIAELSGKRDRK
jgi:hypothetical protein